MSELELSIDHVSFVIADVAASIEFYTGILGLQKDYGRPDLSFSGIWFKIGYQSLHLLQVPNPDSIDNRPEHGGRDRHLALHTSNLDKLIQRLSDNNITFTRSRSGRAALFCRDPDGNGLEFIQSKG